MRPLDDGADHHAGTTILAGHLDHCRVADGEVGGPSEHSGEGLRVAAGGTHLQVEAVLLEDPGVHTDVQVNVTKVVHGFAEPNRLQLRCRCPPGDNQWYSQRGAYRSRCFE